MTPQRARTIFLYYVLKHSEVGMNLPIVQKRRPRLRGFNQLPVSQRVQVMEQEVKQELLNLKSALSPPLPVLTLMVTVIGTKGARALTPSELTCQRKHPGPSEGSSWRQRGWTAGFQVVLCSNKVGTCPPNGPLILT